VAAYQGAGDTPIGTAPSPEIARASLAANYELRITNYQCGGARRRLERPWTAGKQAAGRPVGPANHELQVLSYEWRREVLGGSWLVISGGGDSPCAGARECDSMRAPPPEEGEKWDRGGVEKVRRYVAR